MCQGNTRTTKNQSQYFIENFTTIGTTIGAATCTATSTTIGVATGTATGVATGTKDLALQLQLCYNELVRELRIYLLVVRLF